MEFKVPLFAIISTACWGSSFTIIKIGLKNSSPILFAFLRYLIAGLFFSFIALLYRKKFLFDFKNFLLIGIISISIPIILQNIALKYTSAYISGFIQSTGPIYTLIFASIFLNEKMTFNKILGILIAFIGTYLIVSPKSGGNFYGNLLVGISAIFYSIGSIMAKKLINHGYKALNIVTYSTLIGALFLFPPTIFENVRFNQSTLIYAFILALFPTFIAYILWYESMKEIEISKLSCYVYLIPFFSTIFSYALIHEEIKITTILYGIIIITGIAIAEA